MDPCTSGTIRGTGLCAAAGIVWAAGGRFASDRVTGEGTCVEGAAGLAGNRRRMSGALSGAGFDSSTFLGGLAER